MVRRHAISPAFSGHYQNLGISSLTGHDSAFNISFICTTSSLRSAMFTDKPREARRMLHLAATLVQNGHGRRQNLKPATTMFAGWMKPPLGGIPSGNVCKPTLDATLHTTPVLLRPLSCMQRFGGVIKLHIEGLPACVTLLAQAVSSPSSQANPAPLNVQNVCT